MFVLVLVQSSALFIKKSRTSQLVLVYDNDLGPATVLFCDQNETTSMITSMNPECGQAENSISVGKHLKPLCLPGTGS